MANVAENLGWVDGIYQIETTDVVEGGADGVANLSIKQLASRTKYLYDLVNAVLAPFIQKDEDDNYLSKGWVVFNDIAANIPPGWAEVTEMRGRIGIGMDSTVPAFNSIGNTGGSATKTLTATHIPPLTVTVPRSEADTGELGATKVLVNNAQDAGTFNLTAQNNNIGGANTPFDAMNPYRVVLYIKWVGLP